jgi:S1-C subfamily serine protease/uncharacterized protein
MRRCARTCSLGAVVLSGTAIAVAQTPSFDCSRARLPDEIAICRTPELAVLESTVADGYSYLKATRGRPYADQIGIPFWQTRKACQYDVTCIQGRLVEEISALRAAGAPIPSTNYPAPSNAYNQVRTATSDPSAELRACRSARDANEKIEHCSRVIDQLASPAALATAHNTRGLAFEDVGRFDEAIDDFNFVIRYEPRIAGFYDNRQNAYRRNGQLDLALRDANKAVELAPTYSFVFRSRGNVYTDMGQLDLAIADYDQAIRLAPVDGGLFIDRGKIYCSQRNFDHAISDFTHALDLDQKWTAAYRERGLTYKELGQSGRAIADLDTYNKLEPSDPTVILALRDLTTAPEAKTPPPPVTAAPEPAKPDKQGLSSGTGFFIASDGSLVTNAHPVKSCSEIAVLSKPGSFSPATVLATDQTNDLVLLKTNERPDKVAALRPAPRLGEPVEAFGYPLADLLASTGNFSLGNISALSGLGDDSRYLQISVPVQPGNSGGPLLDQHGNVVGIVSSKLNAIKVMLQTEGDIPQNVNFAIKASVVQTFLQSKNVQFVFGDAVKAMEPPDIAELAKAISVFVVCR